MYIFIYIQKLNMSNTKSNNGGTASKGRKTPYDEHINQKKIQGPYGLDSQEVAEIQKELRNALGKKPTSLADIYKMMGIKPEEHKTGDNTGDKTGAKLKEKLRNALGIELTSLADIYRAIGIEPEGDSKKNGEEGR